MDAHIGKIEQRKPVVIEGERVNDVLLDKVMQVLKDSVVTEEERDHMYHAQGRVDDFSDFLEESMGGFQGETPQRMFEIIDHASSEDSGKPIFYSTRTDGYPSPRFAVPLLERYSVRHELKPVPVPFVERALRQLGALTSTQNLNDLQSLPERGGRTQGRVGSIVYGLDTNISSGVNVTVDLSPDNPRVQLEIDPLTIIHK